MNKKWRTKFSWSNSRQNLWDSCKRAYYFNYIACWGNSGGQEGKAFRDKLWKLKKLTRLIFMKGHIIHKTCSFVLSTQKVTHCPEIDMAMKVLKSFYKEETKDAKDHFLEFVNGDGISQIDFDQTFQESREQIVNFYNEILPQYEGWDLIETEEFYRGMRIGEYGTTVVFDALFRNFEGLYLLDDFKTGKTRPGDANKSAQLTLYIMAVAQKYQTPIDTIIARLLYLKSGQSFSTTRTEEQVAMMKNRILDGSSQMLAVKTAADMPESPSYYGCRDCNFLSVCEIGKDFLKNNS